MDFKNKNLREIKEYIQHISIEEYPLLIENFKKDGRKSVYALALSLHKKLVQYQREMARLEKMKDYEKEAYKKGCQFIAGMDEVGRGPLAGPVVSAAVILPKDFNLLYIDDSKKLSLQKREALYLQIKEQALDIGIGVIDSPTIDQVNIFQATKMSMALAVKRLQLKPDILLIDGMQCENISLPQWSIVKGDSKSISIAAASIIAKVTRDRMMDEYHHLYPYYFFNKNKGYGTEEHRMAIQKYGIVTIHRKSFLKNIICKEENQ